MRKLVGQSVVVFIFLFCSALASLGSAVSAQSPYRPGSESGDSLEYEDYAGNGGDRQDTAEGSLEETIPGVPGDDYPIFAEVPDTSFVCDGLVEGGYYADVEAECQVFHICGNDGNGGLTKYSFLCPNGTIFNQNYFICDWWFNFDCAEAEDLYSINDDIAAERAEIDAAAADAALDSYGAGEGAADSYGGPTPAPGQAEYNDREGRSGRRFNGRRG